MNTPQQPAGHQPRPLQVPTRPLAAHAEDGAGGAPKIAAMPMVGHQPTDEELAVVELVEEVASPAVAAGVDAPSKIKAFGIKASSAGQQAFTRQPAVTGRGACRVRSFHSRLSDEGLAFMDDKINGWLDRHPEIEVKLVTTSTAVFEGKIREPALVVNVWY